MDWIKDVIFTLRPLWPIIAILGAMVIGEELVIFLTILSARGFPPLWQLVIFSFIGLVLVDCIWFRLAKTKFFSFITGIFLYRGLMDTIKIFYKKSALPFLIFTKFLTGVRVVAVLHLSHEGMKFKDFIWREIIAVLIWMGVFIPLAWLAGNGITKWLNIAKNIEKVGLVALMLVIVWWTINWIISKLVIKKAKKKSRLIVNK